MSKVAIIVPIYNSSNFLEICLESIKNQTLNDIEVILINDGSTDNSVEICERFCKDDKRFALINKSNTGVSDSRNIGIKSAKSEYIMFVDADDWLEKQAVEIAYTNIKKNEADICQFNYFFNYENQQLRREKFSQDIIIKGAEKKKDIQCNVLAYRYAKNNSNIDYLGSIRGCWNKIFSKEFLEINNLFFDTQLKIQEDTYFMINALEKVNKIIFINEYLYHYRQNMISATKGYDKNRLSKNITIIEKFNKFLEKDKDIDECIYLLYFEILIDYISKDVFHINKEMHYNERKSELNTIINKYYVDILPNIKFKYLTKKQKAILFLLKKKVYVCIFLANILKNKKIKNGEIK